MIPKVKENSKKDQLVDLVTKIEGVQMPAELKDRLLAETDRLRLAVESDWFWRSFQQLWSWTDWVAKLPWQKTSQDLLDLNSAAEILNKNHYGLQGLKDRVLEYLSVMILKEQRGQKITQAPILCFVGLVGTGKTTIAKSIAESLGRQFIRIPFGGLGDPLYLRGQSRLHAEAEPGQIIKGLVQAKVKNPVILLDEIDRVADESLNTIMGVLVELLDPEQNDCFVDHFVDYPFNLSSAIFIATANNTRRIATAVLDRLEILQMPSYSDKEKIIIGRDYLLPSAIAESGLNPEELVIADDAWQSIVRPLGYDAGVRTLKRTIERLCRQTVKMIVKGEKSKLVLDASSVKEFLPQW